MIRRAASLGVTWVLLIALLGVHPAIAIHFPWDQRHDVFEPNPPPSDQRPECPSEDNRCETSHPVDIGSGNKIQRSIDFILPGFGPWLALVRTFHSQDLTNGPFGLGWHTNLTSRLFLVTDGETSTAIVVQGDGKRKRFTRSPNGSWRSAPGTYQTLSVSSDGSAQLRDKDGTLQVFDTVGRLIRIQDKNNNTLTLTHDAQGVISRATAASGRSLIFTKGPDGRIASVTDPLGRTVRYFYDADGYLSRVLDPIGGETGYTYLYRNLHRVVDPRGNTVVTLYHDAEDRVVFEGLADGAEYRFQYPGESQTRIIDPLDRPLLYTFNQTGQPIEIQDPLGRITRSSWDENFNRLTRTDGRGHLTAFDYDGWGNLIRVTDALGQVTAYTYEPTFDRVTSKTDPEGHITRFEYDPRGNLTRIIDAEGHEASLDYDARGLLIAATDPRGRTTRYELDAAGSLIGLTDALGQRMTMSYDGVGNLASVTDTAGRTSRLEYDGLNRLTRLTDPAGGETSMVYDPNGNLTALTDPRDQTWRYQYDSLNRLIQITNPLGQVERRAYDLNGNLISLTDIAGNVTTFEYDGADQLVSEIRPGNAIYRYEYDEAGNQIAVMDPTNVRTVWTFDEVDRRTAVVQENGDRETYRYDRRGQKIGIERLDGDGRVSYSRSFQYDGLSRLIQMIAGAGQVTAMRYDSNGNLSRITDPLGRVTILDYDALDRLSVITDAIGAITGFDYDMVGNLIGVSDPLGLTTRLGYDALDRQDRLESPETGLTSAIYDANGNLVTHTDSRGIQVTHGYDVLDRRTFTRFAQPGEDRAFLYDQGSQGAGRLTGYDDETGQTRITYDARGNILTERRTIEGRAYQIAYRYDAADRLIGLTYPSGLNLAYTYDEQGRLLGVTANGQSVSSQIRYLPFGPPESWIDGSGQVHHRSFDADYRLISLTAGAQQTFDYRLDLADNITEWIDAQDATQAQLFQYDALDRVVAADGPYGEITFSYDQVGNRLTRSIGADLTSYRIDTDSHRLLSAGSRSFVYDAAGNLIQDDRFTYVYNQANRLAEVQQGGVVVARYLYNAEGQRVVKRVGGQTLHFVYDLGGQLIGIYDPVAGDLIEELIYRDDVPIATVRDGLIYQIQVDHLGTPRGVSDADQTLVWQWTSGPFGEGAPRQDPDGDGQPFVLDLRFPGQYFDAETGRHYNYFRDYDPALGRYVQSDPIGIAGGLNTYLYAAANPVRYADPRGLMPPIVGALALYGRCLAECAIIEAVVAAMVCPPNLTALAATCAVDCLNPVNWLPGTKIFEAGKEARKWQEVVEKGPLWSSTKKKSAAENAYDHWRKHRIEFPELQNANQYVKAAREFLLDPPKGTQTKTNDRGDVLRYDPATNTFGVLSKDGAPRTMFRPKDGIDYWNRQ